MKFKKVRVFFNRRSGPGLSRFQRVEEAFERHWAGIAGDIAWVFPTSREDSLRAVRAAVDDGADLVAVCGGDGTVSSIAIGLIGTGVPFAVVPMGSGNGLARHFRQKLDPVEAVAELAAGRVVPLDVARANGHPFIVSASVAWDAELVRAYDRLPMRGVGSYVLAGAMTFLDYAPQPLSVSVDGGPPFGIDDPMLFTVGNASGWGGGAIIDPASDASDGRLELVAGRKRDAARMLADIAAIFTEGEGSRALPGAIHRSFARMRVERPAPQPIQLDGERVDMDAGIEFTVDSGTLGILVPGAWGGGAPPALSGSSGTDVAKG